jgi:two-component system CheB/CheR fusion protein
MPYRTLNNVIDGVVLTFDNITERKAIELALINSEHRYKRLFDYCPLAIWVENFAEIENQLTQLRAQGILDLKAYLIEQIDFLETLMTLTQFEQLNTAALRLFNASNYDELLLNMPRLLNQNNTDNFIAQLMAIWEQKPALQLNYNSHDYQGKPLSFSVDWTIAKHLNKLDYSNTISVLRP